MVYVIQALDIDPPVWKVGHAIDCIKRIETLQIGSPVRLRLVAAIDGSHKEERRLHKSLPNRSIGEWFYDSAELRELISQSLPAVPSDRAISGVKIPFEVYQ